MKTLESFWQSLESIRGQSAIPAFWEARCCDGMDLLRPHLRVTDMEGSLYPCPERPVGYCPRRIVDYGDGEYAALCRDPYKLCATVPLTRNDVLLRQLDIASFTRMLAPPLGIRWHAPVPRAPGAWAIGLSARKETRNQPVIVAIVPEADQFAATLRTLLLGLDGPFVLVAPTSRNLTVDVEELLQKRGVAFVPLDEHLLLDDAGRSVTVGLPDIIRDVRPTPKEDRRRVVRVFTARNRCKVKDIQEAAGVDEADYYKWLSGKAPDHYSTCVAIERVLNGGLPRRQEQETHGGRQDK
jgi:hypothetical protein